MAETIPLLDVFSRSLQRDCKIIFIKYIAHDFGYFAQYFISRQGKYPLHQGFMRLEPECGCHNSSLRQMSRKPHGITRLMPFRRSAAVEYAGKPTLKGVAQLPPGPTSAEPHDE